ncbi:hypothetical protein HDV01_006224 [Terramyces sp. JEL0728]|nr:hypothetical protein HDV01_006224 [Terramyces sp. JEL0728]
MLSEILGWTYFFSWSLSFYPQVILNHTRKSVQGLSLDFVYLNFLGFICYAIYNTFFYYSKAAQQQYFDRFGSYNQIQINDVVFAVHALILTGVTFVQTLVFKDSMPSSTWAKSFIVIAVSFIGVTGFGIYYRIVQLIDGLYFLSLIKMTISLIKYTPQVILNYQNKSTVGWSIENILLDLLGGVLSIGQQLIDSASIGNWTAITGNPVKFGMGFASIFFDLIFIVQHYVLYPATATDRERLPLLAPLTPKSSTESVNVIVE